MFLMFMHHRNTFKVMHHTRIPVSSQSEAPAAPGHPAGCWFIFLTCSSADAPAADARFSNNIGSVSPQRKHTNCQKSEMILDPLFKGLNFKLSSEKFPRKNHIICFRDGNKTNPEIKSLTDRKKLLLNLGKKETQCAALAAKYNLIYITKWTELWSSVLWTSTQIRKKFPTNTSNSNKDEQDDPSQDRQTDSTDSTCALQ